MSTSHIPGQPRKTRTGGRWICPRCEATPLRHYVFLRKNGDLLTCIHCHSVYKLLRQSD